MIREVNLLMKDLCARLHYGVICNTERGDGHLCSIDQSIFGTAYGININPLKRDYFEVHEIKPYLRPMSSMTDEEKKELKILCDIVPYTDKDGCFFNEHGISVIYNDVSSIDVSPIDWLNSHHFDYRGLIEKRLALKAPEDMYEN